MRTNGSLTGYAGGVSRRVKLPEPERADMDRFFCAEKGHGALTEEKEKIISTAIQRMIELSDGNLHDIDHFLKVWAVARTIGELEGLDRHAQEVLELTAVVHDIACPLCREKRGDTNGKHQELESPPLVAAFFEGLSVERPDVERISWLVAHHHTYTNVDGIDHRILLEADLLVNAGENGYSRTMIEGFRERVFRTAAGTGPVKIYAQNCLQAPADR